GRAARTRGPVRERADPDGVGRHGDDRRPREQRLRALGRPGARRGRGRRVTEAAGPVLYYDGECGVCTRSVALVLRHDRRGTLRFASLRGAPGGALLVRHPELAGVDSMFWVEAAVNGEVVLARSEAV